MPVLPGPLLVVTDRHQAAHPLPALVARIAEAGARWIWLRDRDLPADERGALARVLQAILVPLGGTLLVGGDPELAAEVGAGGAHVRAASEIAEARLRLGPAALLGVSAHGPGDLAAAHAAGADYATLSPIFASASKPGYGPAVGADGLAEQAKCPLPIIALGGVETANVGACRRAGAAGIAVMGGVMRASRPENAVRALLRRWNDAAETIPSRLAR